MLDLLKVFRLFFIPHMTIDSLLDTPGKRFTWFIEENYESIPRYVERFEFNASQIYRIVGDTTSPRFEKAMEYAATGINLHWMATGEGGIWWAPNEVGIGLAKKKGIVVGEHIDQQAVITVNYDALLRAVLKFAEESSRMRIKDSEELPKGIETIREIITSGLSWRPAKEVKKVSHR